MDRITTLSPHPDRFKPTMTSLEQVDFINVHRQELASACGAAFPSKGFAKLEHKDFLEKVTVVLGPETSAEFSADLPDRYGRPRAGYRFPKREACLMAMSYSYELQAKVFDRMTALEARPAFALPDFTNPAAAARAWADAVELSQTLAIKSAQQQTQLAIAAPKVKFVDQYVESTGLKGFREVAKLLQLKENWFRKFLADRKIMYRLGGEWMPYAPHLEAGRFEVKTGTSLISGHAFNEAKFTAKGIEWIAGLVASERVSSALKECK